MVVSSNTGPLPSNPRDFEETMHSHSPKLSTSSELEPIEDVSHTLPKGLVVCLEAIETDAKHAKHLHATEAVEAQWWAQESRDATYRIANALPLMERSEFLGVCAVLSGGVSLNEGAGGKMSSWGVDGGGGVSSNPGGGGIIGSAMDMFDSSRDGGTCNGGATALAVECLLVYLVREEPTAFRDLDRPTVVYHHRGEVAWEHHQLRVLAVEFLVAYPGEE